MSENYTDKSKTISKIKRYANVTTAVSGLAARLAGEKYLGLKIDRKKLLPKLYGALIKNEQDIELFEQLAFMSRGNR